METKVKFKYIDEYTHKTKSRVFNYDFPEFTEIRESWQGKEIIMTIEEQMMEHLDRIDKSPFMSEHGMITFN